MATRPDALAPSDSTSSEKSNDDWKIAVAVVIPIVGVALIAGGILAFFYIRRRKQRRESGLDLKTIDRSSTLSPQQQEEQLRKSSIKTTPTITTTTTTHNHENSTNSVNNEMDSRSSNTTTNTNTTNKNENSTSSARPGSVIFDASNRGGTLLKFNEIPAGSILFKEVIGKGMDSTIIIYILPSFAIPKLTSDYIGHFGEVYSGVWNGVPVVWIPT